MNKKVALTVCVWLISAIAVSASPLDRFGFAAQGPGMGNAMAAGVDDYTAVYYNPAALGFIDHPTAGFGLTYHDIHLEVDGANKTEFVDTDGDGIPDHANEYEITAKPEDARGIDLGLSVPVGGILRNRLGLGFGLHTPGLRIIRVRANDPDDPYFYMYDNDIQKLVILAAAGVRISDMFSIGGGAQIYVDIPVDLAADIYISGNEADATRNPSHGWVDAELELIQTPFAGILFKPNKKLKFGLAFRDQISVDFQADLTINMALNINLIQVGGEDIALNLVAPVPAKVKAETLHRPRSLQFGSWYDASDLVDGLRLSFDLQWYQFSAFEGNQLQIYISPQTRQALAAQINGLIQNYGPLLEALPISGISFSEQEIFVATKEFPKPNFRDIFVPRIGFEYDILDWWTARAGYFYEPTPVPDQKGLTCYVDSDRHVLSMGSTFTFDDPLQIADYPVEFDVFGQYHQLKNRTTVKQKNNDVTRPDTPYTRYESGGVIYGGGVGLTWHF